MRPPPQIRFRQELKHLPRYFQPTRTDVPRSPEGICSCCGGAGGHMQNWGPSGISAEAGQRTHQDRARRTWPPPTRKPWASSSPAVPRSLSRRLQIFKFLLQSSVQKEAVFANLLHKHVLQSWGFIKPCTQSNYRKNSALFAYLVFKGLLM